MVIKVATERQERGEIARDSNGIDTMVEEGLRGLEWSMWIVVPASSAMNAVVA
jgi:hypothetical protein